MSGLDFGARIVMLRKFFCLLFVVFLFFLLVCKNYIFVSIMEAEKKN